ncbi:Membrane protein involved in the export of O-antigen and teichoic acid [Clostridium sp. USBA 49]|uniref:flippase n=1 Tax=Clostridium sp. USBA 49 TaxID=1881060 RepID=UPI0009996D5B|nr:flippase [Clostridium sp. USBA 49]SKA87573.1 Membrane protein involved in the export of O-antigen and teichoic acid [Clostridium sp. USBA 49]
MSVIKNYIYNIMYQILILIIPLITVPYVSRVLGADGVGINSYTNSIVQYFILFGMLGIGLYGNRTIATVREDKEKLSKTFWSIYTLQIITCSISIVAYLLFIFIFFKKYLVVAVIQSLNIVAAAVDLSWFFMGLEQFKKTVTRNSVVKIISVIFIFLLIKDKNDIILYVLILSISNLMGNLIMWGYLKNIINLDAIKEVKLKNIVKHLNNTVILFIPQIATQIYTVLDKTMIGIFANTTEVGIYENSEKIVKITLAVVTSLGTVMLPRMANMFSKGEKEKINEYIDKSIKFVSFVAIPIMFGIATISKEFVPWFFGEDFSKSSIIIPIISPIILFIAWSNVLGIQYMIPIGKNKEFTFSVTIGAIVNFVLNIFLIKHFESIGAAISTVIAEVTVTIVQIYILRKDINISSYFEIIKCFIAGAIMAVGVRLVGYFLGIGVITTLIQIFIGSIVYFVLMILLKSSIINNIIQYNKNKKMFLK